MYACGLRAPHAGRLPPNETRCLSSHLWMSCTRLVKCSMTYPCQASLNFRLAPAHKRMHYAVIGSAPKESTGRLLCSAWGSCWVISDRWRSSPLENRQIVGCSMIPRVSEFRANSLIFAPLYPPKDRDEHAPTPKQACRPMPFQGATRTSHSIEPLMILEEILVD